MKIERLEENSSLDIIAETTGHDVATHAICVSVGDSIESFEENTLRGHGTHVRGEHLVATVCGVVDRVNKLITVRALHRRYGAEVGDVVIGRVTDIGGKRWKIDLQSKQEAHLMISAVSLPGAVQRRRTAEDELHMRSIFKEGDLVSAEVQAVHQDGTILLHTRSTRYGLLKHGQLVQVSACLVKRQRQHLQTMEEYGVDLIIGCNGLIWVGVAQQDVDGSIEDDIMKVDYDVSPEDLRNVARVAQSIRTIAKLQATISSESIECVVGKSVSLTIEPSQMLCSKEFLVACAVALHSTQ